VPVSRDVIERLRRHTTPTICNAIEEFGVRPRHRGFMGPQVRCIFPELPPMVGHAVTVTVLAGQPPARHRAPTRPEYWDYVLSVPEPRVVVVQDLDPTPIGSFWGEVNATIHRALGCVGTVTNGGVRDVDEVRALGFQMFASCLLVSHAYVHIVDYGGPVHVGGLEVHSGDLLHGDQHGVTSVPADVAERLEEAVQRLVERERRILEVCRAQPFDLERLKALFR
jgi:4-hydroxy-4-methyl-2-oxoglutarate aldolase